MIVMFPWFLEYIPVRKSDGIYRRICAPGFISKSSIMIGFNHLRSVNGHCIYSLFAVPSTRIHCGGGSLHLAVLKDLSGIRQRTKEGVSERAPTRIGSGRPSIFE